MPSYTRRVFFAAALLHLYFAAAAPTPIGLAGSNDLGFQPGTCHVKVTQIQQSVEGGSPNLIQVSIVDDWGHEIGSCSPTSARNAIAIKSSLPHELTVRTQDFDDPVLFEYWIQSWTTDAEGQDYWRFGGNKKCSVSSYSHSKRLIDCEFRCP